MPIYEYECTSCGHRFEQMVRIDADAPPCPECAAAVRKLISQSAFILKGGGWYKDHYGLKSGGSSSGEGSSGKSEGAKAKDAGGSSGTSGSSGSTGGSSTTSSSPTAAK